MDKRQHQRIMHVIPASIEYIDRGGYKFSFSGVVQDVSVSGIGIRLDDKLWGAIAVRARVEMILTRSGDVARWPGYVARMLRDDDGSNLLGIVFDRPRYGMVATLKEHVSLVIQINEDLTANRKQRLSRAGAGWQSWFKGKE